MSAQALLGVGRTVADFARTASFYRDGLGFAALGAPEPVPAPVLEAMGLRGVRARCLRMELGGDTLAFLEVAPAGAPYPSEPRATDPFFQHVAIPVRDMAAAVARLGQVRPQPISDDGPEALPPASGGVVAYKARDPDGHPFELILFPGGAPARRWAQAPGLFLGIDHSALTVTDLGAARAFFVGALGLREVQRGLNRGSAQAHLDGVPDPEVDVLALEPAAAASPHVELLHYRRPPTDRPTPAPYGPADRASSRLLLAVTDVESAAAAVRAAGFPAACARDGPTAYACGPDGHGVILQPTGTRL